MKDIFTISYRVTRRGHHCHQSGGANPLPPASITSTSSTSPPIDRSGAPAAASVAAQTDSGSSSQGPSGASTDVEMQRLPPEIEGSPEAWEVEELEVVGHGLVLQYWLMALVTVVVITKLFRGEL
ncbi:hypothetical protein FPSE_00377 [Fusarium pseudograminearum CS3096]|uniref:Uncharacterized protein n=1 Tax=Fusarium pseudograminearum (strain CS3096) TaxID=1028729 RepID=K3V2F4_FUSPC|nr:hypothetical protein FPSE_00377 [Fusarium pseudograminearum CS3096]EKJ79446.1 hypothetical protein FPSE_00377 [Fusarium pseudograminearum CS3096]